MSLYKIIIFIPLLIILVSILSMIFINKKNKKIPKNKLDQFNELRIKFIIKMINDINKKNTEISKIIDQIIYENFTTEMYNYLFNSGEPHSRVENKTTFLEMTEEKFKSKIIENLENKKISQPTKLELAIAIDEEFLKLQKFTHIKNIDINDNKISLYIKHIRFQLVQFNNPFNKKEILENNNKKFNNPFNKKEILENNNKKFIEIIVNDKDFINSVYEYYEISKKPNIEKIKNTFNKIKAKYNQNNNEYYSFPTNLNKISLEAIYLNNESQQQYTNFYLFFLSIENIKSKIETPNFTSYLGSDLNLPTFNKLS